MKTTSDRTLAILFLATMLAACGTSGSETDAGVDPGATTDTATTTDVPVTTDTPLATDTPVATDSEAPDTSVQDVPVAQDTPVAQDVPKDTGNTCNDLVPTTAYVPMVQIAQDKPTLPGGTIVDGTYVLTKWEKYLGVGESPSPQTGSRRDILSLSGGNGELVVDIAGVAYVFYSFTYTVEGATMTVTKTCPEQMLAGTPNFEATADTFTWLNGKDLTGFKKL